MDIQETLQELGQLAPQVPAHLNVLIQRGEAVKSSAETFLAELKTAKDAALELSEEVTETLAELVGSVAEQREALSAQLEEVDQTHLLIEAIQEARGHLQESSAAASAAIAELNSELAPHAEEIGTAAEALTAVVDSLGQKVASGRERLRTAASAVEEAAGTLTEEIGKAKDALVEKIEQFGSELEKRQSEIEAHLEEMVSSARSYSDGLRDALSAVLQQVVSPGTSQIVGELKERVSSELKSAIDEVVDHVLESMREVAEKVEAASVGSSEARLVLEPLFKQLNEVFDPINNAVESVKSAASSFGVDF